MTIKVNIIKTEIGYDYRNADSNIIVAIIKEARNEPDIYFWQIFNGEFGFDSIKEAEFMVNELLSQRAVNLGCDIEFINI